MKNIVFITHHMGIQGSYLNHLDLQQHLKDKGYKIKFYCENVKNLFKIIKDSRRNYIFNKGEVKKLKKNIIEPYTVITDFKTLMKFKELGSFVICKKVIIMDSIELTYHLKKIKTARFYYNQDIYESLKHFYTDEILFLMPPNNYKIFIEKYPDLNAQIYFKKINVDILKTIKYENREGYFYRWDDDTEDVGTYQALTKAIFGENCFNFEPDWTKGSRKVPLKYNEIDHIFDYNNFIYRRRKYLEYQEQFGRLIFEYILLGKTVYFIGEPFTTDGLTDYLIHYNIKFEGNKIITAKKELIKRMEKNEIIKFIT